MLEKIILCNKLIYVMIIKIIKLYEQIFSFISHDDVASPLALYLQA